LLLRACLRAVPGTPACAARAPRACAPAPAPRAALPLRSSGPPPLAKPCRARALRTPAFSARTVASAAAPAPAPATAPDWAAVRADIAAVIADPSVPPTLVGDKGPTLVRCCDARCAILQCVRGSLWLCPLLRWPQVRLAFHASGTYDKQSNTGGRRAMRNDARMLLLLHCPSELAR
jgi:hypothetical protein